MFSWVTKKIPLSSYVLSVAYMMIVFFASPIEHRDTNLKIWFVTALPVAWAWTAFIWWRQSRSKQKTSSDPGSKDGADAG